MRPARVDLLLVPLPVSSGLGLLLAMFLLRLALVDVCEGCFFAGVSNHPTSRALTTKCSVLPGSVTPPICPSCVT